MVLRGLTTLALSLALVADNAVCGGWETTAEARMACCVEGACAMHLAPGPGPDPTRAISQADADRCCASSESPNSTPTSPVFALALPPATLVQHLFAAAPLLTLAFDPAREPVPLTASPVPKHLLLSVFLI